MKKPKTMEDIYKLVADEYKTTPKEVKREISAAIKHAWSRNGAPKDYQNLVPSQALIPNNTELIAHILHRVGTESAI